MINKIKKTRFEIENLYGLFASLKEQSFSPKFSFFLLRNIGFLESEIKALTDTRTQLHESIKEYDSERTSLAASMADKDENGQPIIDNSSYRIIENLEEFNVKFLELKDKHKDSVEKFQELETGLVELLGEEVEQDILSISYLDIPENVFTLEQLFSIRPFFKESEEELDELLMG